MTLLDPRSFARLRRFAWVLAPLAALAAPWVVQAEPAATVEQDASAEKAAAGDSDLGEKWVRLVKDKRGKPVDMETAIVRYVLPDEFEEGKEAADYDRYVDLVGAVHIGDRSYYRELNRRFRKYDAVLYELVAAAGTKVPKGRGTSNSHPLGALQNGLKNMLEVEHQLEQIDYTRPNMVHADLSPEEFMKSMADREDGFVKMYFRLVGAQMAQQNQSAADGDSPEVDLMAALFSQDRPRQLKIAMAKQFESMEALMTGMSGPDGSTLITDRNSRALDVLEKEFDAGKETLAIFYGAGHLAEMDDQVAARFGLRPVSIEWVEAWDLREK